MGSIRWNRLTWGNLDNWRDGGDAWDFHATFCRQPYESWKDSVVKEFLTPYLGPGVDVVEIGPGQGRWSEPIIHNARTVALVDLSANCIGVCRRRFADAGRSSVSFFVNDGVSLPVSEASVDLVWSFGTFVHIELAEIDRYLAEIHRVLRPGGTFVIHHAGLDHEQRLAAEGGSSIRTTGTSSVSGLRSDVSASQFAKLTVEHELLLGQQVRTWGHQGEYGLAFGDVVSIGVRAVVIG